MKKRHYKCENCGADLIIDAKSTSGKCEYCGSAYYIESPEAEEVHHYFGNVKITPLRVVASIVAVAVLVAAIVIVSLYFTGVFEDKKPPIATQFKHEKAYLYEGTYLVGEDMDKGEYVAFKDPSKDAGRILILTDKDASAGTSACIAQYRFANNAYFTVEEGLYVKVEDCNIFKVGDMKVDAMSDGTFEGNAVLRGGSDIPVGNYILCNDDKTMQYASIKCIIGGKQYEKTIGYRCHLNIGEGDYVYLTRGKLYAEKDAPAPLKGEKGEYLQGQYKVGLDIPAGRYKIYCGNAGGVAYFVQNSEGFAFFDKSQEVSPSTMNGYLDLQEGDYIYLYMISLYPAEGEE